MAQPYNSQNSSYNASSENLSLKSSNSRKRKPVMQTYKPKRFKRDNLMCDICGIEVTSQQTMDSHIRGRKHLTKLKLKTAGSINLMSKENYINQKFKVSANVERQPHQPSTNIKQFIGFSGNSALQSMNELAKLNKVTAKYDLISESGPEHRKKFEVQLTIADETYTGSGTSIKRAQQIAAERALATTKLRKTKQCPPQSNSLKTGKKPLNHSPENSNSEEIELRLNELETNPIDENKLEIFLTKKHAEIAAEDTRIKAINDLIQHIQQALKTVSNRIMEEYQSKNIRPIPDNSLLNSNPLIHEDPSESYRMIKGAVKVSILSMGLCLKTDYQYSLVLVCANKPTVTLLNNICQKLTMALNNTNQQTLMNSYQVQVVDACLIVKSSHLPSHIIRIMLTSPVFYNEQNVNLSENSNQNLAQLNADPIDMLDKYKCLQALIEIRHFNWFSRTMLPYNYNLIVLQLLRYLQYKQTPLSYLNLWCLIVIVNKCQNKSNYSISTLFHDVFSYLSSGILLSNNLGSGIIDPCEKDLIDITSSLTNEQRSRITTHAQYILHLISSEQMNKLFSID